MRTPTRRTRLPTHVSDPTTQVGQDHAATGVLLVLGTNTQPSEPKLTKPHSGNLNGLLPVLHRSDRWPAPVRPVTPVRPVDRAGQAGGYSSRTANVPGSLSESSRPWNKNHHETQPVRKKNPSQILAKQLQTLQELISRTTGQNHTDKVVPRDKNPPRASTGQTGQEHRSDRSCLGSSG